MKLFLLVATLFFVPYISYAQTSDLNYYLEQAKKNSPLINKANNENKLLQLDLQRVKSILYKPVINVESNVLFAPIISHDNNQNKFQWVSEGAESYTGYDLAISDGGQYNALISIKQPLFLGKTYKSYSNQAEIQSEINKNNIKLTEHELEQLVSRQYILCELSKQQSQISKSLLNKLNDQVVLMKKLVENAVYKQTDLMLLKIETENFKIEYEKYLSEYRRNIYDLNLICGISDTSLVEIKQVSLTIKPDTLKYSRFLKKFTLDSMDVMAQFDVFKQKYIPRLNIFANAGMNATYLPAFNRFGFATGINFTWNIFDGHQKKIEQNKSFVKMQKIEFEKNFFINRYNTNKEKFISQIKTIEKQIDIVKNQLVEYKKLMKFYKYGLSQAQISIMDLKNLIRDISAKEQEYLRLQMTKQILISSYNYWNY